MNKITGLSPGKILKKSSTIRDKIKKYRKLRSETVSFKRRRLQLKQNNSSHQQEFREGTTYQTNICLSNPNENDCTEIPPSLGKVPPENIDEAKLIKAKQVFFYLETTSLYEDTEITQISAFSNEFFFDQYVLPEGQISGQVSKITGIAKVADKLFVKNKPVESLGISDALEKFGLWLQNFECDVVLIGHNVRTFDSRILLNYVNKYKEFTHLFSNVLGFVDTLPLFKARFPEKKGKHLKQGNCWKIMCGT